MTQQHQASDLAQETDLDRYIDGAARLLALPVEAEWRPAVEANLTVNLRHAAVVAEVDLPDEAEPASVFEA